MIHSKFGTIVLVPFPFTDLKSSKKRPALVLTSVPFKKTGGLVIVAMITSQTHSENIQGDYLIESWKEAGLLHESKLRLAKLVSIENKLLLKKMGEIPANELKKIKKEFTDLFSELC